MIVAITMITAPAYAQHNADSINCPVKDIGDLLRKDTMANSKPPKNYYLFGAPVIGSSPATGFIIGLAGQITFKGKNPLDKYSVVNANFQYTTKNQILFQVKNNLLLAQNKLILSGDMRIFIYSQPTYGLGTDALNAESTGNGIIIGNESVEPDSIAENMFYNYYKLHQLAAYNIKGIFYLGAGLNFDIYQKISVDYPLLSGKDTSFHTAYSLLHGYDSTNYALNGISAHAIIDTRDNQINATKGIYMNLSYQFEPNFSKQQKSSSVFSAELRYFKTVNVMHKHHTIAWWAMGTFTTSALPYLSLPALGWDQRSRSGRGYAQGTFRGQNFVYGEIEYRFPITCNEVLGGVLFINGTTASDKDREVKLFRFIQPAFGIGLRINMDKASRTNLVLDYGIGKKSNGFYLNAGETY
ncbi:MAG: outer membrane protein assembly factor [Chitinophagales bacterium]|nr:outer membrane protein assembly factor [Chitinophagales bacterium]